MASSCFNGTWIESHAKLVNREHLAFMDKLQQSISGTLTGKGKPNAFQRLFRLFDKHALWLLPTLAWLAFWWPIVIGQSQLFARDLTFYALPLKTYMMERFWQGEFPMWTPRVSSGMPFFAELSNQVLYPLNALFFLVDSAVQGISWQIAIEHLFGFLAMAYLARVVGFSKWVSIWVSIAYGLAGYNLGITDNINYHPAVAWTPLMLAFFIKGVQSVFKEVALPWFWLLSQSLLTALPMVMLILAGDTFTPLFLGLFATTTVIGLSAFWLWKYRRRALKPVCQLWFHWFFSFSSVFLLCAVQILPSWELMQYSVRQNMLAYSEVTLWSFPWERIVEFAVPYFYGSRFPEPQFVGMFLYPAFREPWADSVYLGFITLAFALVGLCFSKSFFRWVFLWMAVLAVIFALGANAAYYPLLVKLLPILKTQRYLEKFIFFTTIAIPLLAGYGIHAFSIGYERFDAFWKNCSTASRLAMTVGLFLILAVVFIQLPAQAWIWPHTFERSGEWGDHFYNRGAHVAGLYWHFFLIALPLIALLWVNRTLVPLYVPILLFLGLADLMAVHYPHFPTVPSALLRDRPTPHVVPELKRRFKTLSFATPKGGLLLYYDDMVDGTDAKDEPRVLHALEQAYNLPYLSDPYAFKWIYRVYYNQERLLFNYGVCHGFAYQNGRFAPLQLKLHKEMDVVLTQEAPSLLMQLSGVHYVVTPIRPQNAVWEIPGFREVYRDPGYNLKILAVEQALPRAYVAPNPIMNTEPRDVYFALVDKLRDRPLSEWAEISPLSSLAKPVKQPPYKEPVAWRAILPTSLKVTEKTNEAIRVDVNSPYKTPLPLIVTESWFPGWKAILDGKKEIPIVLANHRFLGVTLPPGNHSVLFQYRSTYFSLGLWISLASALLSIFIILLRVRLYRQRANVAVKNA